MARNDESIDDLIDMAERLADQGAITEALVCWRAVLERQRNATLLCRFGRLAMKADRLEEAEQAFLAALELDPGLPYAYDCLALWQRDQGNLEQSLNYFNRSLAIKETAPTFTLLGAAQLKLGRVEAARDSFRKALSIDPRYEEAYYNLGLSVTDERPAEAVPSFRKAVELDPDYAMAHRELGWALRQLEHYPEAEYHLRRAVELDESDGWAFVYLGNLLWTKGEIPAAEQSFKKAIEVWPEDSFTHWCLAIFYEYQGRPQEADFFYEKAVQLDPDDPTANFRFGMFLKQLGENAKARVHLEHALSSDPMNETAKSALAELDW